MSYLQKQHEDEEFVSNKVSNVVRVCMKESLHESLIFLSFLTLVCIIFLYVVYPSFPLGFSSHVKNPTIDCHSRRDVATWFQILVDKLHKKLCDTKSTTILSIWLKLIPPFFIR